MTDTTEAPATPDSPAAGDTPATETPVVETTEGQVAPQEQAQTETTEGEAPAEQKESEGEGEEPKGAPEEYADFTAPEGVSLDEKVTGDFKAVAKELNLSQGDAQRVYDLGVQMAQSWGEQQAAAISEMQAGWRADAEADPEIGGDKLAANLALAKKATDAFGSDALRELMETSKLGDHPEFIRFALKVGQAISEDALIMPGGEAVKAPRSHAERIFKT